MVSKYSVSDIHNNKCFRKIIIINMCIYNPFFKFNSNYISYLKSNENNIKSNNICIKNYE